MTTKPVSPKFVDLENVKESLATGLTVVHPYVPGLLQIISRHRAMTRRR
jgi:hypothetical protein